MRNSRQAVCVRCNHRFTLEEDTVRKSHLLHCVRCGRSKRIRRADLKDYFRRYLTTLLKTTVPGNKKTVEPVKPLFSHQQIDSRKYIFMVEHLAGSCICGAVFRFSGKMRCPACRSTVIRKGSVTENSQVFGEIMTATNPG